MSFSWLRFSTNVMVRSPRPVEECVRSLQTLTAPPNSYGPDASKRPFRGRINSTGGVLRRPFPMLSGLVSCRKLKFQFNPTASGTELRGEWRLLKRIQIPVTIYLLGCAAGEVYTLVRIGLHRQHNPLMALVVPLISFAMIYGWTLLFILLSRNAEAQVVGAVFHSMASDESTKIVGDVLSGMQ